MSEAYNPSGVVVPFGAFSNIALQPDGQVVHVAGQVAWDADGNLVGKGDMAAQCRQVCENVRGCLKAVGGDLDDIVSVIVYVTDMTHLAEIHAVRRELFSKPYPASTLVQVAGLVQPDLMFEMSAVAVIPHSRFHRPG
ncbi:MAG: RidA family protein [Chromatiales bacterium]|nr:RidA family protein [Chromatiales bacterium]